MSVMTMIGLNLPYCFLLWLKWFEVTQWNQTYSFHWKKHNIKIATKNRIGWQQWQKATGVSTGISCWLTHLWLPIVHLITQHAHQQVWSLSCQREQRGNMRCPHSIGSLSHASTEEHWLHIPSHFLSMCLSSVYTVGIWQSHTFTLPWLRRKWHLLY